MKVLLFILAAVCAYLICGINPAILLSKLVYHEDIREKGSGNPGFTNFKRCYGNLGWVVLFLDLFKGALVSLLFGWLMSKQGIDRQFAIAYTGLFALLGHSFPIWYQFKGGKGFLVYLAVVYVIDWRVGLIATVIMVVLLLTTKYMSLSTVVAMLTCPIQLALFGASARVVILCAICVIYIAVRHKENFKRLREGTESKFYLKKKKSEAA